MRGLAEFIMRGRWQALGIAVLGSGSLLFGWISAAAIALVTLRKGTASGGWLVPVSYTHLTLPTSDLV